MDDNKYLGPLCKRGHDHDGTGQSLRYKSTCGCIACLREYPQNLPEGRRKWWKAKSYDAEWKQRVREQATLRRAKYAERSRGWVLKRLYGITKDDYDRMYAEQEGRCKICRADRGDVARKLMSVDHCHATGRVRGLLCGNCNRMLGMAKDNVDVLKAAIEYLGTNGK